MFDRRNPKMDAGRVKSHERLYAIENDSSRMRIGPGLNKL